MNEKKAILSLGGSLVAPTSEPDAKFLSEFRSLIRKLTAKGYQFFLIVGGGWVSRHYRDAAKALLSSVSSEDLDWLGIKATQLNALLVKTVFGELAEEKVIEDYEADLPVSRPVVVGSGWRPGCSSDFEAVVMAEKNQVQEIINLTNTDYVYRTDPKTDPRAQPIKEISWTEYRQMIGGYWTPGLSVPFDPVASQKAQSLGLTVKILNGKKLENLEKCLRGKAFVGTVIADGNKEAQA